MPFHSSYHPVVVLPKHYEVLDLSGTAECEVKPTSKSLWTIGRYDEVRPSTYPESFRNRTLHVGLDIGGPAGTAVHAFADANVLRAGYNPAEGDYGGVIVLEVPALGIYALHGHLSKASLQHTPVGSKVTRGEVIGWIGTEKENGGWPPHVHFQLSKERPKTHDMPGVVDVAQREMYLEKYPDPRIILGDIY